MAIKSFYPNLSNIVTIEQMPEQMQFLKTGLQNILS